MTSQCFSTFLCEKEGLFMRYNIVIKMWMQMRTPCELVVKLVLPAFRSLVAKTLIAKYHFSQVAAAQKLGTTQATISHYLYSKRGDKRIKQLEAIPSIQSAADEIALSIATEKISPFDAMLKFCGLCKDLRTQNIVCELHKDFLAVPESCDLCLDTQKTA
jgi:predicted transcriptional regulator